MMIDYESLSPEELKKVMAEAQKALDAKWQNHKKSVLAEIRRLAASIDVDVIIKEKSGKEVERKPTALYVDPANPENTWPGRGQMPRWLKKYLAEGHHKEEFKVA